MPIDAAIKKSLEFRKRLLANRIDLLHWFDWHDEVLSAFMKGRLQCDPKSLEDAAQFFGLDYMYQPHREILLHLLAQAVFGKHKRGPPKGKPSAWSPRKKVLLGMLARNLKRQNPKWSNEKIAAEICETEKTFKPYRKDPRAVRKQISIALDELEKFECLYEANRRGAGGQEPDVNRERSIVRDRLRDSATRARIYSEMSELLSRGELDFVR